MQLKPVISNPLEGLIIKLYTKLEEKRNVSKFCSALIVLFFFFFPIHGDFRPLHTAFAASNATTDT